MAICEIHLDPKTWDLSGEMEMSLFDTFGAPIPMVHVDKAFRVQVTVTLKGDVLRYLCGSLCVELGFESLGSGNEPDLYDDKNLDPCGSGIYVFNIVVPPNTLSAGHCGKVYDVGVTLGSTDACGKSGFIFGTCGDFDLSVMPAV
jgi:hypothetical protein